MKQKIYNFGIVSAMILVLGTLFKVQHWPGASILLFLGTLLILGLFLPSALINHYRVNGNKQYRLLYITTYLTCFVVFTAMLFKIQHWPFAGFMVLIAVPFPFIVFLPIWLYVTSRIKNFDINNTVFILFLLALQAVFSVLLAMNVTREKIFYSLQITNQISSFNSKIEKLPVISVKSTLTSTADEVLAQIDACRQLIFKRTEITRKSLVDGTINDRYLDSKDIPQDLLISSSDPSPAVKLNSAIISFVAEISKLPEGKKIAETTQNLFDLNTESEDIRAWQFRKFQGVYLTWDLVELDAMENYVRVVKTGIFN